MPPLQVMRHWLKRARWGAFICLENQFRTIDKLPVEIGAANDVDWRLGGDSVLPRHCSIRISRGDHLVLTRESPQAILLYNGAPVDFVELHPGQDHAVQIGHHLLIIRGDTQLDQWRRRVDPLHWTVIDPDGDQSLGPEPVFDLCRRAIEEQLSPDSILLPEGASAGFYLRQLAEVFREDLANPSTAASGGTPAAFDPDLDLAEPSGELLCPNCWLRFDLGEVMHIATHAALNIDPVLGPGIQLRFHATQFNDGGMAIDGFGAASDELACPHCRLALPDRILQLPMRIVAIAGPSQSGKSNFLAGSLAALPDTLPSFAGLDIRDRDPAANAPLNRLIQDLAHANTAAETAEALRRYDGKRTHRCWRHGRFVDLPRPFSFLLSKAGSVQPVGAVAFYDNAGTDFDPENDSPERPATRHLAVASAIAVLINGGSRQSEGASRAAVERPSRILLEVRHRLEKSGRLMEGARLNDVPMAVVIAGAGPGKLPSARLSCQKHSEVVRQWMLDHHPDVVLHAESLSSEVRYFISEPPPPLAWLISRLFPEPRA